MSGVDLAALREDIEGHSAVGVQSSSIPHATMKYLLDRLDAAEAALGAADEYLGDTEALDLAECIPAHAGPIALAREARKETPDGK